MQSRTHPALTCGDQNRRCHLSGAGISPLSLWYGVSPLLYVRFWPCSISKGNAVIELTCVGGSILSVEWGNCRYGPTARPTRLTIYF